MYAMSVPHRCMQSHPGACREPVLRLYLSSVCRVLCVTSPGLSTSAGFFLVSQRWDLWRPHPPLVV